jgi:hypothetical protein
MKSRSANYGRSILTSFGIAVVFAVFALAGAPLLSGIIPIKAEAVQKYKHVCTHAIKGAFNLFLLRYSFSCPSGTIQYGYACCRAVPIDPVLTPTPKPVKATKIIPYIPKPPAPKHTIIPTPSPIPVSVDTCTKSEFSCELGKSYCDINTNESITCVCQGDTKRWVKTPCGNSVCYTVPFGATRCRSDISPTPTPTGVCPRAKYNCKLGANFCGTNNSVVTCACDGDTKTWISTSCGDKKCVYGGISMVSSSCQ